MFYKFFFLQSVSTFLVSIADKDVPRDVLEGIAMKLADVMPTSATMCLNVLQLVTNIFSCASVSCEIRQTIIGFMYLCYTVCF